MMISFSRSSWRHLLPFLVAGCCFILLLTTVSACQVQGQSEKRLPRLLDVIYVPGPSAMAMTPGGLLYVINLGGMPGKSYIALLDGPKLVDTIPWPDETSFGAGAKMVFNHRNNLLYVLDLLANQLYVIRDTELITTMGVGYAPREIIVHPDSGLVYIANPITKPLAPADEAGPGEIVVIEDTQIIHQIPLERPHAMTFSDFDKQIYVGQSNPFGEGAQNILVTVDDSTFMTQTIYEADPNGGIYEIAIDDQNGHMYLTRGDFGLITYWNGTEFQRIDVGSMGYSINTITVDSRKNRLYAASWDGPPSHVVVIEGAEVIAEIPVGYDVRGIAVDETHDYVYAANYRSDTLSVIRGTEVITTLETGGLGPWDIEVDERRGYIYVTNSNSAGVAVFGFADSDTATGWRQFLPFIER